MRQPKYSIQVTIAPEVEPVTLEEAKLYAKIDTSDDDDLIEALIKAAREAAEKYTGRALITQTIKYAVDAKPSRLNDYLGEGVYELPVTALSGGLPLVLELPYQPVQSVESVVTYNSAGESAAFSADNYYIDTAGGRLALKSTASWPADLRPFKACEITYIGGYGDGADVVPSTIKIGIMRHVQAMYDLRIICDMPAETMNCYQPYRLYA